MKRMFSSLLTVMVRRLALGVITLLLVSVVIFSSVALLPGSYASAVLGQSATKETVAAFEQRLGLDRPAVERYALWIGGAAHGDFGYSFSGGGTKDRAVSSIIAPRFYNTILLAAVTGAIAIPVALILGLFTALHRNSWFDRLLNGTALGVISVPEFFVAYLLTYAVVMRDNFDATQLAQLLPIWASSIIKSSLSLIPPFPILADVSTGSTFSDRIWGIALPSITLGLAVGSHVMRMTRAAIINLMASPYIEMAALKGVSPSGIVLHHALPNAWAPIANVIALNLAYLIVGAVVVEVVFVYPGIGQLMVDAVRTRDIPVVQACALIFAASFILFNLLADVVAIITNPRLLYPR